MVCKHLWLIFLIASLAAAVVMVFKLSRHYLCPFRCHEDPILSSSSSRYLQKTRSSEMSLEKKNVKDVEAAKGKEFVSSRFVSDGPYNPKVVLAEAIVWLSRWRLTPLPKLAAQYSFSCPHYLQKKSSSTEMSAEEKNVKDGKEFVGGGPYSSNEALAEARVSFGAYEPSELPKHAGTAARNFRTFRDAAWKNSIFGTADFTYTCKNPDCNLCDRPLNKDFRCLFLPLCGHAFHPSCLEDFMQAGIDFCPGCAALD